MAQLQQRLRDDLSEGRPSDQVVVVDHLEASLHGAEDPSRGVWPRVESTERVDTDSKGRLKTRRGWHLMLSNQTGGPVPNVRYEFLVEQGRVFDIRSKGESEPVKLMPPGGEQRWPLTLVMGSVDRAECRVTWEDATGEHVTEATVTT